jgi:hypothetical protein
MERLPMFMKRLCDSFVSDTSIIKYIFIFLDRFNISMLKINFKNKKIYYFNIF